MFEVSITISEERWNAMSPAERIAERARLQAIVDRLYDRDLTDRDLEHELADRLQTNVPFDRHRENL